MTNRIIKFRAWDKKRNQMLKVSEMLWFYMTIGKDHFENSGVTYVEGELHEGYTKTMGIPLSLDSICMQFTGLFDKNGKEIYEGDILEYRPTRRKVKNPDRYLVEWVYTGFIGKWGKGETTFDLNNGLREPERDIVVVGNIYETPKLYKK